MISHFNLVAFIHAVICWLNYLHLIKGNKRIAIKIEHIKIITYKLNTITFDIFITISIWFYKQLLFE